MIFCYFWAEIARKQSWIRIAPPIATAVPRRHRRVKKTKKDLTEIGVGYIGYNTNVRNFGGVSSKLPIDGSMRCNFVAAMSLYVLYISEIIVRQWS